METRRRPSVESNPNRNQSPDELAAAFTEAVINREFDTIRAIDEIVSGRLKRARGIIADLESLEGRISNVRSALGIEEKVEV